LGVVKEEDEISSEEDKPKGTIVEITPITSEVTDIEDSAPEQKQKKQIHGSKV
jgi:hypothetical protein